MSNLDIDKGKSWIEMMDEPLNEEKSNNKKNPPSRKRPRPSSKGDSDVKIRYKGVETDPVVLQRRQKQIDYGKNTFGYHNYTQQVPIDKRTKDHPKTPEKYAKYSRRSWDALIKIWRKKLHEYDTRADNEKNSESDNDDIK